MKQNKYTFTWQDTHIIHQLKLKNLFKHILGLTRFRYNEIKFYNFKDNKYFLQDIVMRKQLKVRSDIELKDRNKRLYFELDGNPLSNFKITFTQYSELDKDYFIQSTEEMSCYKLEFDGEVDESQYKDDDEPLWNVFDDDEYKPLVVENGENEEKGGKRKTRRNRKSKKGKRSRKARKSRRKSKRRRGRR